MPGGGGDLSIQKNSKGGFELYDALGKYWNFSLVFLNPKTLFESIDM